MTGKHVELYTLSGAGAPVWQGWGHGEGRGAEEGLLSSLFRDSERPGVRSGLRRVVHHSFPWLCPWWARPQERRKGDGAQLLWAGGGQ